MDSILDINLNGTWRSCQIFGKTMVGQGFGKILNIASLSTFVGFNQVAAYGVSKAGVGALTKSLAFELAPFNMCVNAIAPGISHRAECRTDSAYRARTRVENAHAHEALWRDG
jgi:NAD(P)-dependent dehydrogenase (short-subunit alcohol dehydrogenase family)